MSDRKRWIEEEIARVKRAGCQKEMRSGPCGLSVEVETMTELRGTWLIVSCDRDESHVMTERI